MPRDRLGGSPSGDETPSGTFGKCTLLQKFAASKNPRSNGTNTVPDGDISGATSYDEDRTQVHQGCKSRLEMLVITMKASPLDDRIGHFWWSVFEAAGRLFHRGLKRLSLKPGLEALSHHCVRKCCQRCEPRILPRIDIVTLTTQRLGDVQYSRTYCMVAVSDQRGVRVETTGLAYPAGRGGGCPILWIEGPVIQEQ
nr:hypothetical protein CFP56_09816 [Quercus suber]